MHDRFQTDHLDAPRAPDVSRSRPQLPAWLARRLLREGEQIESVRGPRHCPAWEPYVTHPGVALIGLALAVALVAVGGLTFGFDNTLMAVPCALALVSAFGG